MGFVEVHFDYVVIGDDVEVGAVLLDDGEIIDSALKPYENLASHPKSNNFQFSILAWRLAVDMLIAYCMREGFDYSGVEFCNQNEHMFKWFEKRNPPEQYVKNMTILAERLTVLSDFSIGSMKIKLVKGKDNRAKKILKKRKDKKVGTVSKEIDLSNMEIKPMVVDKGTPKKSRGNEVKPYGGDVNLKDRIVPGKMGNNVVSMDDWDRKKA